MADRLSSSLQESALTMLAYSDKEGRVASGLLSKDHFEPPYDKIAERLIEFRRKFETPPADAHLDDLFDDLLMGKDKLKDVYRRVIIGMHEQSQGLNAIYTLTRLRDFVRHQVIKTAILEAGEIVQHDQHAEHGEEAEQILLKALRANVDIFDPGARLSDKSRALKFLEETADILPLGIEELDKYGLGPARKEAQMLLAPQNRGKSWYLDYVGRAAMLNRDRVLHITLEMSETRVMQRYLQTILSVAKRGDEFSRVGFKVDSTGRMTGLEIIKRKPKLSLDDPAIRKKLVAKMDKLGTRFLDRLIVKEFPTAFLSFNGLRAYLDMLETTENFIPDTLIIDYPKIMGYDRRDPRVALGALIEQLRGLCVERNMRGVFVHQGTRNSASARTVGEEHVSEDWSIMQTVDTAFTYSQTEEERELNLARLYVAKGRNDKSKFTVVITQQYEIGQFALASTLLVQNHWTIIDEKMGKSNKAGGDD